jgi:hypothetical protein
VISDATLGAVVKQAPVTFTGPGDNTVVVGVAGQRIKILGLFLVLSVSANMTFKSASTALTGVMQMFSGGSFYRDFIQLPLNCNIGDSFVVNVDQSAVVGGTVWYIVS